MPEADAIAELTRATAGSHPVEAPREERTRLLGELGSAREQTERGLCADHLAVLDAEIAKRLRTETGWRMSRLVYEARIIDGVPEAADGELSGFAWFAAADLGGLEPSRFARALLRDTGARADVFARAAGTGEGTLYASRRSGDPLSHLRRLATCRCRQLVDGVVGNWEDKS
jgi:hypothetical protein